MSSETSNQLRGRHQESVVVIGSGFGGLFATQALRHADVEVTVIDRMPYHLFQPLLYQVSTGILSEGEIAPPTREVLRRQRNARVLLGEVTTIDLDRRTVTSRIAGKVTTTPYDSLIVAAGSGQSYFGNERFAEFAPGMKTIDDALELRARIFGAFELAELEQDPVEKQAWLTFVVVGGGPTGVEMAGQLAELSQRGLHGNFTSFDARDARVILIDAGAALLAHYGPDLSEKARKALVNRQIDVRLSTVVVDVDAEGVDVSNSNGSRARISSRTKIWAAGVSASPLGGLLARASGAELSRTGQVVVLPDCTIPGHPEVYVVGDLMDSGGLPGVAQVAIQSGRFAARQIIRRQRGRPAEPKFTYRDKGMIATISRFKAVALLGPVQLSGFIAWLLWLVVHLFYLIGFRNRVTVLLHWFVTFLGRGRSERTAPRPRLLAEPSPVGTPAPQHAGERR